MDEALGRRRGGVLMVLLVAVAWLGMAQAAQAGTLSRDPTTNYLKFSAAVGETNAIDVFQFSTTYYISDFNQAITDAGSGCNSFVDSGGGHTYWYCTSIPGFDIHLNDMNDSLVPNQYPNYQSCSGCAVPDVPMTIDGSAGTDYIIGGLGADKIHGGTEADTIYGGDGNDTLFGDAGTDVLDGQNGNDTLLGGAGADDMYGEAGTDAVSYDDHTAGVIATLAPNAQTSGNSTDAINSDGTGRRDAMPSNTNPAAPDIETLIGSPQDDTLSGNDGAQTLAGGDGNDILRGGKGLDVLDGGNGFDFASYSDRSASQPVSVSLDNPPV
ncbi:MAG: hypothetical protein QOE28_298, partial [Solirubrobacteraceae bacterium]|nr:hypothetical protein [Solirubrobacteraceae bacterium]